MVTYTKLKNGDWGLRGSPSELKEGTFVTVTTKAGKEKKEKVGKVLWTGKGFDGQPCALAIIASNGSGNSSRDDRYKYPRTGCSCGSRDGYPQESDCWQCKHDY